MTHSDDDTLDRNVNSREIWWLKDGLDDSGVDGEDGKNDTRQEDQSQLVDIFHPNEDNHSHHGQAARAVNTHVIQQGIRLILLPLGYKDGSFGQNVGLECQQERL